MSLNEQIREAIKGMSSDDFEEMYGVPCVVDSVDENALTCECSPVNGDSPFLDVRIQAGSGNGVVIIPQTGSIVIVQPLNSETGYISLYSQIESIKLLDGSFGGLIKVEDLVSKLNTIEDDINTLKDVFTNWVVAPSDGGAALKSISASWAGDKLDNTNVDEIENEKITHGDI